MAPLSAPSVASARPGARTILGFLALRRGGTAEHAARFLRMAKLRPSKPQRRPGENLGLSGEQENALLAIEMMISEMKAHGDALSQWRLAQIERALEALDQGQHADAMNHVERARTPARRISKRERAEAAKLERRLEADQLMARLAARRELGQR
jgi:hypothetical protein